MRRGVPGQGKGDSYDKGVEVGGKLNSTGISIFNHRGQASLFIIKVP